MKSYDVESWVITDKCPRCDGQMKHTDCRQIENDIITEYQIDTCQNESCGYSKGESKEEKLQQKLLKRLSGFMGKEWQNER